MRFQPRLRANATPATTASRQTPTLPAMFAAAKGRRPDSINRSVSMLNVEKVVKAPSTPVIKNSRRSGEVRPRWSSQLMSRPSKNEPTKLTDSVPHGKVDANL